MPWISMRSYGIVNDFAVACGLENLRGRAAYMLYFAVHAEEVDLTTTLKYPYSTVIASLQVRRPLLLCIVTKNDPLYRIMIASWSPFDIPVQVDVNDLGTISTVVDIGDGEFYYAYEEVRAVVCSTVQHYCSDDFKQA